VVFAREISDPLTSLVKKIDEATVSNKDAKMGSFAVFCNDDEGIEGKLKDLAKKEQLKKLVLTKENPAGPEGYNIAKDADITVILYVNKKVKANFSYKKGEFKESEIEKILADLKLILPEKK
jgi:hypothetical protein